MPQVLEQEHHFSDSPKKSHLHVVDEEYAEEDGSSKAPFAFDLGLEYQRAQRYGRRYLPFFIENVHYYVKESYARVPVSEYEHEILYDENGNVELVFGPDNESARESYLAPAWDSSKPNWYRKRAYKDFEVLEALQEILKDSKNGDTFIDLSPTEYEVSLEDRKRWGFGYHSFARIHQVTTEGGVKKLVSRAIRNYLDSPEQAELFKRLTGEDIDAKQILGQARKVSRDATPAGIKRISDELYDNTPRERKIIPPIEELENIKSEEEMDEALSKLQVWPGAIFEMMLRGDAPKLILDNFRGWEMAVKDLVSGDSRDFRRLESVSAKSMLMAIYANNPFVSGYINRPYQAGFNGCGLGSGFSSGTTERFQEPMTYQNMTSNQDKESCPEIKCKNCPWKANNEQSKKVQSGKLKECPLCEWSPKGGVKKKEKVVSIKKQGSPTVCLSRGTRG